MSPLKLSLGKKGSIEEVARRAVERRLAGVDTLSPGRKKRCVSGVQSAAQKEKENGSGEDEGNEDEKPPAKEDTMEEKYTPPRKKSSKQPRRVTRSTQPRTSPRSPAGLPELFDPTPEPHPKLHAKATKIWEIRHEKAKVETHSSETKNNFYKDEFYKNLQRKLDFSFEPPADRSESQLQIRRKSMVEVGKIRTTIRKCLGSGIGFAETDEAVAHLLESLGLGSDGRISDKEKLEKISEAIRLLFCYHFPSEKDTDQKCSTLLAKSFFDGDIFGADSARHVAFEIARSVSRCVFKAYRILKVMDMRCQGSLNDTAVSEYAGIETSAGVCYFKRGKSLLPYRGEVEECRVIMNRLVDRIFHTAHNVDPIKFQYGDHIQVDYERLARVLIKGFGLEKKAREKGVEIALTGDGAEICGTGSLSQTAVGFKITDVDAVDPSNPTEKLFYDIDSDGNKHYKNCQSFNNNSVAAICLHCENKSVFKYVFSDFFEFGAKMCSSGLLESDGGTEPSWMPVDVIGCGDKIFQQKTTGRGGACKVSQHFCIYCEVNGDHDMFHSVSGEKRCHICKHNKREKCSHRAMNSREELLNKEKMLLDILIQDNNNFNARTGLDFKQGHSFSHLLPSDPVRCFECYENGERKHKQIKLQETISEDGTLRHPLRDYSSNIQHTEEREEVRKNSKIVLFKDAFDSVIDFYNIDFDPRGNRKLETKFNTQVLKELDLRGYDAVELKEKTSAEERRGILRSHLEEGRLVRILRNAQDIHLESLRTQLIPPEKAIPCILHWESRTAEKIMQQLLLCGLATVSGSEMKKFVENVEDLVNHVILGREELYELGQWKFPLTSDGKLGEVKFSNPIARKIVEEMHRLVEICTRSYNNEYRQQWREAVSLYKLTGDKLRSRKHFSYEDVCDYQLTADDFCEVYFFLTGRDGMTNYFHDIFAGHYAYFLLERGNLYRYSQQGWEALNGKLKRTFQRNTAKGGGKKKSSKLKPVFKTFLRGLLWRFGYGDSLFEKADEQNSHSNEKDVIYGSIYKTPRNTDVDDYAIECVAKSVLDFGSADDIFGLCSDDDGEGTESDNKSIDWAEA